MYFLVSLECWIFIVRYYKPSKDYIKAELTCFTLEISEFKDYVNII